jgi:hypothetical protein
LFGLCDPSYKSSKNVVYNRTSFSINQVVAGTLWSSPDSTLLFDKCISKELF